MAINDTPGAALTVKVAVSIIASEIAVFAAADISTRRFLSTLNIAIRALTATTAGRRYTTYLRTIWPKA